MPKVIHMVRWLLPFTSSFIRNQIIYHQKYKPSIIFAQKNETFFYKELSDKYDAYYPFDDGFEKFLYEKARILSPGAKTRIRKHIEKSKPDILHVHYGVDCLIYADIIKDLEIPTCVSFYGYDCSSFPNRFYGYGKKWLNNKVFSNPSIKHILAMTDDMKEDLIRIGCPEEKIIVHYYGTETAPFVMKRPARKKNKTDILIISSLQERKGHAFLIDAFAKLNSEKNNEMNLHVVGDGYLRKEIEAYVAKTGLDNIILHGAIRYGSKEHLDFFKMADIFVHPSVTPPDGDKEGIPGAIIEAMAAGLPVVSTYHAGIPYIIETGKNGILVNEYDVEGLANALGRLVEDHDYRKEIARAGQQYAINCLDVREKEKELECIYDNLLS